MLVFAACFASAPGKLSNHLQYFKKNCGNLRMPWITCVRIKARAGRRPSSANCSHPDPHQLFFFLSSEFPLELFFTRTRDGCSRSQQAWQEIDQSKARGPEKGRTNFLRICFEYWINQLPGLNLGPVAARDWPSTTFFMHVLAKGIVNWLGLRPT